MAALTIPEIIDGVALGVYSREQGVALVETHLSNAADIDTFAGLAMQSLMTDAEFMRDTKSRGGDLRSVIAQEAYAQAAAMMNART